MEQAAKTAEQGRDAEVKPFPARTEAEAPAAAPPKKSGSKKRLILGAVAVVALGLLGNMGYDYWTVGRFMVSTDDAYLKADITTVSPQVTGYVKQIAVAENQKVKAGDLLFKLDDADYLTALKTAQSQVTTQEVTIKRIAAQVEAAQAAVAEAQAQKVSADAGLKNAQTKNDRTQQLAQSSVAAQSAVDDAVAALDQARAAVTGAAAAITAAQANVTVLQAQQAEAESGLASL